jgi:protein-L-isoaspartate(D-aspartate) O-methyltransferase
MLSSPSGTSGKVVGIEHIPELVKFSVENLRKDGLGPALDDGRIVVVEGDGRQGKQAFAELT